jgi:MFS family permease
MFVLEGVPSIILGCFVLRYLTDHPVNATWLDPRQRAWLQDTLAQERKAVEQQHARLGLWQALTDRRVLALCLVYFSMGTTAYGLGYFLPQIIKAWGLSNLATGWTVAVPETIGIIAMLIWGSWSDRVGSRRRSLSIALMIGAVGLACMGFFGTSPWSLIAVAAVSIGFSSARPMFWTLPPTFLSGRAIAGSIALISCFANFGGIVGPVAIGWAKTATNSFAGGLYLVAFIAFTASMIVLFGLKSVARD